MNYPNQQSRVFQLSGLSLSDLDPLLLNSVRALGGQVLARACLDPSCTHLVVGRLAKTEKVLLALARGIWIVGADYMDVSVKSGYWQKEDRFDVGGRVGTGSFRVAPREIRWGRARKGGAFAGVRALVLLDETHKRDVYERILRSAGAQVLEWTWQDLPSTANSKTETLIFSEPDVLLDERVQIPNLSVFSYLFISENLIKESPPPICSFNLENEEIRIIHKQYKTECSQKASNVGSQISDEGSSSVNKNNSIIWGPSSMTIDRLNRKRQASLPLGSRSKRFLSESVSSDTSSSPRKTITRRSKLISSTPPLTSSSTSDDSSSLTDGTMVTSVDLVRNLVSEKGVSRHLSLYGSNVVDYVPKSMHRQLREEDMVPQEHFFNHVLETYVHCKYDDETDRSDMWLWAISFLRDSCSKTVYPSLKTFRLLLHGGILTQASDVVCHAAGAYLMLLVEMLYPPVSGRMCQYYQRAFSRNETSVVDPYELWNFMLMLIDVCSQDSKIISHCQDSGLIALNVFSKMLEVNFHHWFNMLMKTGLTTDLPLVGQMFWTKDEPVAINTRIKKLLELSANCLMHTCSVFKKKTLLITSMAAQIICAVDKSKKQDTLKEEFVSYFGKCFRGQKVEFDFSRPIFAKISLLKPDWLSLQLTLNLMNHVAVRSDQMLSLRRILTQVKVSKEKFQDENKKPFRKTNKSRKYHGINIAKKNKFGEVALHLACKQGDLEKLDVILSIPNVDVNTRDYNGWTALHEVCSIGHVNCLQALLTHAPIESLKNPGKPEVVDVLAAGGEDQVTAFHEAVDANHLDVVDTLLTIVRSRSDIFPPVARLFSCRTRDGKTVFDLARCAEMKKVLLTHSEQQRVADFSPMPQTLSRISIDEITRFGLCIVLRKYCSEFSLHFIKEALKTSETGSKRRFSQGCNIVGHTDLIRYNVNRSEPTCATDLRSFNDLRLLDFSNLKYVDDIAKMVSLR